ncbi:carbamoyl-phosphate synthase large subunit [Candidatus Mesenet endosymbiont of Agriotes lineatus]|uniref:carbamoyl-phosphate synthase large subunit n=1 Tax=Candidatus Mesenet endosymbiont of Agriotes lineatus TaxID=3077948 RepID=UPI0030D3F7A4
MPKRTDIESILLIGAGPIIIGQACEFDYSGTQACKVLKSEGYRVILVNSNPATVMTDPELSDATYIEPITPEIIKKIIVKERPNAILPTMGGQTALNCAMELGASGVLSRYNIELLGVNEEAIKKAENRSLFCAAMDNIGLKYPKSIIIKNIEQIGDALGYIGLPAIIRSSFTLAGTGSGIAYNKEEFLRKASEALEASPIGEIQIDESVVGWKEYEMEVIRDSKDNCIVVCSIENIDPMGVHTGDSITVAPVLTLRDAEYQKMREASIAVLREIGVSAGGANVQFAVNPKEDGSLLVIEMNPRVSRSSAIASKATGFPIAKIATKLAIGYTLDEIRNDVAPVIPAAFEPAMDYIVTKIPRFNFDKFPGASKELSTSMKSVGEVMSVGRCFSESLQKALRSLENDYTGLDEVLPQNSDIDYIKSLLAKPLPERLLIIADAIRHNISIDEINEITGYDLWFLKQIEEIIQAEDEVKKNGFPQTKAAILPLKKMGFSDNRLAKLSKQSVEDVESIRKQLGIRQVYKHIDTCAAEFEVSTNYMYGCYEGNAIEQTECEANPSDKRKVVILGSGPNRIGQGIEFDYACVHAAWAAKEMGYETIMINCNPETVSTDYDISDRLYFSPLVEEDVIEILEKERENGELIGVIVQLGGQTPLKLAKILNKRGIKILGTSFDSIDLAEDRMRFKELIENLKLKQPMSSICFTEDEVIYEASKLGFPIMIRPSYVLGGQSMSILHDTTDLKKYLENHSKVLNYGPLLIDEFLTNAIEVDVDALCDGKQVYIAGIMEHIEEAGIHSGDSACSIPPYTLDSHLTDKIKQQTIKLALALRVKGLINIQYAIYNNEIYVLEANPRASRTVPFISKATGIPIAKIATKIMLGAKLEDIKEIEKEKQLSHIAVKEAVFPFSRFADVDALLGPEMKSTGEVMGIDSSFEIAFAKAHLAANHRLPTHGKMFISVKESDKELIVPIAKMFQSLGFKIYATKGTALYLSARDIETKVVNKVREGRPHIVDMLLDKEIDLVINTSEGKKSISESASIRKTAVLHKIPYSTTTSGAKALALAIQSLKNKSLEVKPLQEYFK